MYVQQFPHAAVGSTSVHVIAAQALQLCVSQCRTKCFLKHLHNVETRYYCSQTFLSLDYQCRDDISETKYMFWDRKEPIVRCAVVSIACGAGN